MLKFLLEFLLEVVTYESENKMTTYNIAVTVGPNIFRPRQNNADDILRVGVFYDAMIRMMENFSALFDCDTKFGVDTTSLKHGAVGAFPGNLKRIIAGNDSQNSRGSESDEDDLVKQMESANQEYEA